MTSLPFKLRSPTLREWALAAFLALALGTGVGGISWIVNGRFEVNPWIIVAAFSGVVLNMMGLSFRERPGVFLLVMTVLAFILVVIQRMVGT